MSSIVSKGSHYEPSKEPWVFTIFYEHFLSIDPRSLEKNSIVNQKMFKFTYSLEHCSPSPQFSSCPAFLKQTSVFMYSLIVFD